MFLVILVALGVAYIVFLLTRRHTIKLVVKNRYEHICQELEGMDLDFASTFRSMLCVMRHDILTCHYMDSLLLSQLPFVSFQNESRFNPSQVRIARKAFLESKLAEFRAEYEEKVEEKAETEQLIGAYWGPVMKDWDVEAERDKLDNTGKFVVEELATDTAVSETEDMSTPMTEEENFLLSETYPTNSRNELMSAGDVVRKKSILLNMLEQTAMKFREVAEYFKINAMTWKSRLFHYWNAGEYSAELAVTMMRESERSLLRMKTRYNNVFKGLSEAEDQLYELCKVNDFLLLKVRNIGERAKGKGVNYRRTRLFSANNGTELFENYGKVLSSMPGATCRTRTRRHSYDGSD
ncbi:hypothetical protein HDE_06493 [Halotydeus destructor]|nr:hypothetical protein HDE_06493 [Halotydeus destructor]